MIRWKQALVIGVVVGAVLTAVAVGAMPASGAERVIDLDRVGNGKPYRFEQSPDDPMLNAQVDLGALKLVGDELEVEMRWPVSPGYLADLRFREPDLVVPPGSVSLERERILCRQNGALSYTISTALIAPDGKVLRTRRYDPALQRKKEEERAVSASYGPDPRSLVCWAIAHKCRQQPATWPPPPNRTPLEYSQRARQMRENYDQGFFPDCPLSSVVSGAVQTPER